jgi:ribokinase
MHPMVRVSVIGHVEWVEFVSLERVPRPGDLSHASGHFARAAGGGPVVAAVLAELGADVDFFTALGADAHGEAAAAQLRERGIRIHVAWREEPTRQALTLLDGGGERTIITLGERLQPAGSDELEWDRLDDADGVYFTAGDAASLDRALCARRVVASPRARSALEPDGPAIDALVFSAHDRDESRWADRLAHRAQLIVATEGEHGGRWWGESEGRWAPAPLPGAVRDAYGAGDSFAAGFTFALATGASVATATNLGARCGARCLTRVGAP